MVQGHCPRSEAGKLTLGLLPGLVFFLRSYHSIYLRYALHFSVYTDTPFNDHTIVLGLSLSGIHTQHSLIDVSYISMHATVCLRKPRIA